MILSTIAHKSMVKSWRWLHAVSHELNGRAIDWTQLDNVITAIPNYQSTTSPQSDKTAPSADYRITGLKVAREPHAVIPVVQRCVHRFLCMSQSSRKISIRASPSHKKVMWAQTDSSMIPFAWSAGWNSPQAWNKYQDKVGGHLKQAIRVRIF